MGGVNLLSYYRIPVKFKKRYHCLIWHFLNVACIQIWLYKKDAAATFVFETLQNCRWPNHCYIKRKSYVGDHQDHQLTRVTQQKLKKDQLRQYLIGQSVLKATNNGLNFAKQKAVVNILGAKEFKK